MGRRLWNSEHQDIVREMVLDGFTRAEITRALREFCGLTQKSAITCYLSVVPRRPWPIKSGWRRASMDFIDSVLDWDDYDDEVLEELRLLPDKTRRLSDMLYNQDGPLFRLLLACSESGMAYRLCRKYRKQKASDFSNVRLIERRDTKKAKSKVVQVLERYAKARTQESRGTAWARNR